MWGTEALGWQAEAGNGEWRMGHELLTALVRGAAGSHIEAREVAGMAVLK